MMGRLIDDLLAFSRLGRAKISMARLDVGRMIREIWKEMEGLGGGRDGQRGNVLLHTSERAGMSRPIP